MSLIHSSFTRFPKATRTPRQSKWVAVAASAGLVVASLVGTVSTAKAFEEVYKENVGSRVLRSQKVVYVGGKPHLKNTYGQEMRYMPHSYSRLDTRAPFVDSSGRMPPIGAQCVGGDLWMSCCNVGHVMERTSSRSGTFCYKWTQDIVVQPNP